MITRIELAHFMSHVATVIEPAPGLTVLVGPNNCGKSAVVAALRILCHNENSTYVLRHGERECSVKIETDDGHSILWRRKNSPAYVIDGETFDRLKSGGLPEPLHKALRLPKLEAGEGEEYDVHFGEQKAPIFLLGDSPAKAARFFASSSDAIRLVEMQRRHKEKVAARQREKVRLEAESLKLAAETAALGPAVAIGTEVEIVEALFARWQQQTAQAERLGHTAEEIAVRTSTVMRGQSEVAALAPLAPPPAMQDEGTLSRLIEQIGQSAARAVHSAAEHAALESLAPPPRLKDVDALSRLADDLTAGYRAADAGTTAVEVLRAIEPPPVLPSERDLARMLDKLAVATRQVGSARESARTIGELPQLPMPQDATPIAGLVDQIQAAADQVADCHSQAAAASAELSAVLAELRALATTSVCPACGGPLDVERVLKRAESGLVGGHAHA